MTNSTSTIRKKDFFTESLKSADPDLFNAVRGELDRQQEEIELIASENIVSQAVLEAQGSVLTNKYAEGYSGKRYYGGCEFVDVAEDLAIERVTKLFGCNYANVQSHSGAQANQAVFFAFLEPGDTYVAMSLNEGGHLTHGHPINQSGKWFNAIPYGVDKDTGLIDYDQVEKVSLENKPKIIIAGASAYTRRIDFARFREIADKVGALLMVDMAHYSGLIAGKAYPSPFPHAHVVTSTTHKTLRGPRSGMILSNDEELAKQIDKAVFPGYQGGPLMHVIAAKAVCFGEALQPEFKAYAGQVLENAKAMAGVFEERGISMVSGGTDSHMLLLDFSKTHPDLTGKVIQESLQSAALSCNRNSVPYDPRPPYITSGIRIGTPVGTTRGFKAEEFKQVAHWIADVIDGLAANTDDNSAIEAKVKQQVKDLCAQFPIYPDLYK